MKNDEALVTVTFGYQTFVMPYSAGVALFNALKGENIYKLDSPWDVNTNQSKVHITELEYENYPTISHLSPSVFLMGLENGRVRREKEQEKERAKKAAAEATAKNAATQV